MTRINSLTTHNPAKTNLMQTTQEAELRVAGLQRVKLIIPAEVNSALKAMARTAGKSADEFIGELFMQHAYPHLRDQQAEHEVLMLQRKLGANCPERLASAAKRLRSSQDKCKQPSLPIAS